MFRHRDEGDAMTETQWERFEHWLLQRLACVAQSHA